MAEFVYANVPAANGDSSRPIWSGTTAVGVHWGSTSSAAWGSYIGYVQDEFGIDVQTW